MESTIRGAFGTLRVEQEWIETRSDLPQPDDRWVYTDTAGHEHRYAPDYPTLTWIIDETYWCDSCQDEHTDGHYECPLCGERIEPGLRGPDYILPKRIPGPRWYYLDDEPISEERARALIEQAANQ